MSLKTTPPTALNQLQHYLQNEQSGDRDDLCSFEEQLLLLNLFVDGLEEKTTLHDDDLVIIVDTEDGDALKKVKKSNL